MLKKCLLFSMILVMQAAQALSINIDDKPSLQRGARLYMNYCSGCHSLKYLRYNRMAEDLGLTEFDGRVDESLLKNNLIFTQAAVNDPIRIALPPEDAKQWFGVVPPDLSLIAREKGTVWLYTYLRSFYSDKSRPFGVNNLLVPGVAMPDILEPLLGERGLIPEKQDLLLIHEGELSPTQIDNFLQDLITFLAYVGEPDQTIRHRTGFFILVFLFIFLCVAWSLKRLYWKRIL